MIMWRGELLTSWTGTGASTDDSNRPTLGDAFAIYKFEDRTGQPSANLHPAPNVYTVYFECEADVLDLIEADSDYYVEWAEPIPEEVV